MNPSFQSLHPQMLHPKLHPFHSPNQWLEDSGVGIVNVQ